MEDFRTVQLYGTGSPKVTNIEKMYGTVLTSREEHVNQ